MDNNIEVMSQDEFDKIILHIAEQINYCENGVLYGVLERIK